MTLADTLLIAIAGLLIIIFTMMIFLPGHPADPNLYAPDGYRYGIRLADGSVIARWNGRTQLARAREEWEECRRLFPNDRITLVRRARDGEWYEFEE